MCMLVKHHYKSMQDFLATDEKMVWTHWVIKDRRFWAFNLEVMDMSSYSKTT